MMNSKTILFSLLLLLPAGICMGGLITFDEVITGETTFGFDGDGDGIDDVIFSTANPNGFYTAVAGKNQNFNDTGLAGTSLLVSDLNIEFLVGATGPITFGFALFSVVENPSYFASIDLFDAFGTQIGSAQEEGQFTTVSAGTSSFPEGQVTANFLGVATSASLNFTSQFGVAMIDNFEGTFGNTERSPVVPEPTSLAIFGIGALCIVGRRRKRTA